MSLAKHFSKTNPAAKAEQLSCASFQFGFAIAATHNETTSAQASGGFSNQQTSSASADAAGAGKVVAQEQQAVKSKSQKKRDKKKKKQKQDVTAEAETSNKEHSGEGQIAAGSVQASAAVAVALPEQRAQPTPRSQPQPDPQVEPVEEPIDITEALKRLQKTHISGPAGARSKMKNKSKAKKQQEKRKQVIRKMEEQRDAPTTKHQPEFQTWRDPTITDEERKKRRFGKGIRNLRAIGQRKPGSDETTPDAAGHSSSTEVDATTSSVAADGIVAHSSPFSFGFSFDK